MLPKTHGAWACGAWAGAVSVIARQVIFAYNGLLQYEDPSKATVAYQVREKKGCR